MCILLYESASVKFSHCFEGVSECERAALVLEKDQNLLLRAGHRVHIEKIMPPVLRFADELAAVDLLRAGRRDDGELFALDRQPLPCHGAGVLLRHRRFGQIPLGVGGEIGLGVKAQHLAGIHSDGELYHVRIAHHAVLLGAVRHGEHVVLENMIALLHAAAAVRGEEFRGLFKRGVHGDGRAHRRAL